MSAPRAPEGGLRAVAGGKQRAKHERRDQRVVGVALEREEREGEGDPGIGERNARRPAHATPEQKQQSDRQQIEEDRRRVSRRHVVPHAPTAEDLLEGDVGLELTGLGVPCSLSEG